MAVQFILGRSGTGKSSYCIKAIVDELLRPESNQRLLFLVPEQATYQVERAILADKKISGYSRLHVLSFDRLQFWLSGRNTARPAISRIGREMIIHRILRDNKSKLKIFEPSATWPGLAQQMAQTISELHQYAKTQEDIEQLLNKLQKDERNSLTALKFADIGLIFREYLKFIEGNFLDPDVQLTRACREVSDADFARGAKLWVDGFASFTTSELAILTELLKVAAEAQIALCVDPAKIDTKSIDPTDLFYPTQRTYSELVENIKISKLQLAKPLIFNKAIRFSSSPQLAHVERNLYKIRATKIPASENIRIISAPNSRAEAQFTARQILQLVKERGYRYRDIAVIAPDIDSYEHYIRAYFDDCGIPFFIDKRKPLSRHPVVQLICSALQIVTGGFSHSDIFAYFKTDLVPIRRNDIDLLENYCLAYGIDGCDWQNDTDWHFGGEYNEDFDEQQVNRIRLEAIGPLLELRDTLYPEGNPAKEVSANEFAQTIFDFLDALQVRQTVNYWIKESEERKDIATADEHRQFYDKLISVFDELVEVFAGQKMTCQDYLGIINSAFSQLTLAFIPPTLDQVLVGSIERSRHPSLKAVFLIGATQRQFPAPVTFDNILSEDDRSTAGSMDFPLAPAASQVLAGRQYLTYIAFTRPSEFLCVTYPALNDKGSAVVRSQFIDELQSLFENLEEEPAQTDTGPIHSKTELTDLLCSQLGKDNIMSDVDDNRQLGELLDDICSDDGLKDVGTTVLSAIGYDNSARLDKDLVRGLFGEQIRSSATRLGMFAACPYKYYARYILGLEERKEFKFEPLDLGTFYHRVLDALLKRLNAEKKDFQDIRGEELLRFLRDEITKLVQRDSFISNFNRRGPHNAFIIVSASETLEDCVLAVSQMVRAGDFKPMLSEVSFGEVKNSTETLGEYAIDISDGHKLFLNGKIDRLDIAEVDGRKVAVVFDYKRREMSFNWSKLYYGLDMQLPIYLLAVMNTKKPRIKEAVGAFYIPVEVPTKQGTLEKLLEETNSLNYKAKGIFNGDFAQHLDRQAAKDSRFYNFYVTKDGEPYGSYENRGALRPDDFGKVLKFTEKKVVQLAKEILSGRIEVNPYRLNQESPCSYCEYKPVCRFDWQINDYNFLALLNKGQTLDRIGEGNG